MVENLLGIERYPTEDKVYNGFNFASSEVVYHNLSYELTDGYRVEITVKEKQIAVGTQAMLYLCCPLSKLNPDLIGRTANKNETVDLVFTEKHKTMLLSLLRLLGMLSKSHQQDIINIINLIIK